MSFGKISGDDWSLKGWGIPPLLRFITPKRMKNFFLLAIACIALLFLIPTDRTMVAQDSATVQKWEYKVLPSRRGSATEEELNELGEKGWELVAVRSVGTAEAVFYFKRKKG